MVLLRHTEPVSVLILGAGWTSTFLIPLLESRGIIHAATSTTGRDRTIKFKFDPENDTIEDYRALPEAENILITFPLKGSGPSSHLLENYKKVYPNIEPHWLQLGSTGIYTIPDQPVWMDRHSKYDASNARAIAEDELRQLGGCVLNLSGLWGGQRQPRDWVKRVAPTKDQLKTKTSLHVVHGQDVARAIIGIFERFTPGERWMVTDMFVYDWWSLILGWGEGGGNDKDHDARGPHLEWVRELMRSEGVKALPRSMEQLGRCYDTREFWEHIRCVPVRARV